MVGTASRPGPVPSLVPGLVPRGTGRDRPVPSHGPRGSSQRSQETGLRVLHAARRALLPDRVPARRPVDRGTAAPDDPVLGGRGLPRPDRERSLGTGPGRPVLGGLLAVEPRQLRLLRRPLRLVLELAGGAAGQGRVVGGPAVPIGEPHRLLPPLGLQPSPRRGGPLLSPRLDRPARLLHGPPDPLLHPLLHPPLRGP